MAEKTEKKSGGGQIIKLALLPCLPSWRWPSASFMR